MRQQLDNEEDDFEPPEDNGESDDYLSSRLHVENDQEDTEEHHSSSHSRFQKYNEEIDGDISVTPEPVSGRPKTSGRGNSKTVAQTEIVDFYDKGNVLDSSNIIDESLRQEIQQLLEHIKQFQPQEIELETELKPFIPSYIPSIGDIDAFVKIERPDQKPDTLGLVILDEPAAHQSDPSVLDLHLRAVTKSSSATPRSIRSLDSMQVRKDPKALDMWLKNIKDLHTKKPPASIHYSRRMPDIEDLMQVWPEPIEEALKSIKLPSHDIDLALPVYAQMLALILDIPVSPSHEKVGHHGRKSVSSNVIEALHVFFTLYSEFKNSAHFKAIDNRDKNSTKF